MVRVERMYSGIESAPISQNMNREETKQRHKRVGGVKTEVHDVS
jgi:hypothetical protein